MPTTRKFDGGRGSRLPRSEKTKQKISATQRRRSEEAGQPIIPPKRQCVRCKKWKNSARDFTWRTWKIASGEKRTSPYPRCKKCVAEEAAERRAAKTPEQRRADDRRWYRQRRAKLKQDRQGRVLADPFLDWLAQVPEKAEWKSEIPDNMWRRVRDARSRRAEVGDGKVRISIYTVDKILHAAGQHELLAIMYPE